MAYADKSSTIAWKKILRQRCNPISVPAPPGSNTIDYSPEEFRTIFLRDVERRNAELEVFQRPEGPISLREERGEKAMKGSFLLSAPYPKREHVYVDLEANFGKDPELLQLAAMHYDRRGNRHEVNLYCTPHTHIHKKATQLHGIKYHKRSNTMTQNKYTLIHQRADITLDYFLEFLQDCKARLGGGKCVLVAHAGRSCDFPLLFRYFMGFGKLREFKELVKGCIDTYVMAKLGLQLPSGLKAQDLYEKALLHESLEEQILEDMREAEPEADDKRLAEMVEECCHDARYDAMKMPYVYHSIITNPDLQKGGELYGQYTLHEMLWKVLGPNKEELRKRYGKKRSWGRPPEVIEIELPTSDEELPIVGVDSKGRTIRLA